MPHKHTYGTYEGKESCFWLCHVSTPTAQKRERAAAITHLVSYLARKSCISSIRQLYAFSLHCCQHVMQPAARHHTHRCVWVQQLLGFMCKF